jgi:hypothetical protein
MTQIPGVRAKLAIFLLGLGFAVQGFASNLVTNGDFESGNSGFSTDYTFWPIGTSGDMDAGFYSVVSSANQIHSGFGGAPQGGSQFFVANGATDTSQAVWKSQVISVTKTNQAYRFEAYISSVVNPSLAPPRLSFQIGNGTSWTTLGSTPSLSGAARGQWFFSFADGIFQQAGDFIIRLRNDSNVALGNDLGIDSIYFGLRSSAPSFGSNPGTTPAIFNPSAVPEPSTGALLAIGIGGLIVLRRTRRSRE